MEVCSLEQQATGLEVLWGTAKSFATYQPHKFLQLNLPWFLNYPQWQLWSSQIARKFCMNPKMAQNHPPGETPLQKARCPFFVGWGVGLIRHKNFCGPKIGMHSTKNLQLEPLVPFNKALHIFKLYQRSSLYALRFLGQFLFTSKLCGSKPIWVLPWVTMYSKTVWGWTLSFKWSRFPWSYQISKLRFAARAFGDISIFVRLRFTPLVIDVVAIMFVARGVGGKDVDHHNLHLSSPLRWA